MAGTALLQGFCGRRCTCAKSGAFLQDDAHISWQEQNLPTTTTTATPTSSATTATASATTATATASTTTTTTAAATTTTTTTTATPAKQPLPRLVDPIIYKVYCMYTLVYIYIYIHNV